MAIAVERHQELFLERKGRRGFFFLHCALCTSTKTPKDIQIESEHMCILHEEELQSRGAVGQRQRLTVISATADSFRRWARLLSVVVLERVEWVNSAKP